MNPTPNDIRLAQQCNAAGPAAEPLRAAFLSAWQSQYLSPRFQPIVALRSGDIIGHEALIRGPEDSPLHTPVALFGAARLCGLRVALEQRCCAVQLREFQPMLMRGHKLFLNVSPEALATVLPNLPASDQLVVELTETDTPASYERLRDWAHRSRQRGLSFAIDDLGEGFSSLRLWSELRPEFVKIDKYFIRHLDRDLVKRRFVQAMCELARQSEAQVIAEGIETPSELAVVRSLGIGYGQGYLLGAPMPVPLTRLAPDARALFDAPGAALAPAGPASVVRPTAPTARSILRPVPSVQETAPADAVYELFKQQPDLQMMAVLRRHEPLGLIHRLRMLERYARPYHRELYGGKSCLRFIDNTPLVVDQHTSLQDLGHLVSEANPHHLSDGFIVTDTHGAYLGVVTGYDLIRELSRLQLHAARYANPLTLLPGNVPVNEHIDALLQARAAFVVCHADLDRFKPFNDLYSYRKGDDIIQITATLLTRHVDASADFVGHIGGDDFIVVFRSADWRERCLRILDDFAPATHHLYDPVHLMAGGYDTEDRQGRRVFHALVNLSLGVIEVAADAPDYTAHQIAEAAATAKAEAKRRGGGALFVERRQLRPQEVAAASPAQEAAASAAETAARMAPMTPA